MPCKRHGPECHGHAGRAKKKRRVLDLVQIPLLVEACRDAEERALVLASYDLALRVGEFTRLRACDVDWRRGEVDARRLKGGEEEPLGVARATLEALRTLGREGKQAFVAWTPDHARYRFREVVRHAGLDAGAANGGGVGYSHVLRRSRATHMLEAGATLKDIQRRLGHKTEQTTLLYLGTTPTRNREMDAKVSGMLDAAMEGQRHDA